MRKLAPAETAALEKMVDHALLPPGSDQMELQSDQAVSLGGPFQLKLLPIRFRAPDPSGGTAPHFICGLFLVAKKHAPTFLATFGIDWTKSRSCDGVTAIGTATSPSLPQADIGAYPEIILIYQAYSPSESFPEPVLLAWDPHAGSYRRDAQQSQWLNEQKEGHTVPGARRLLAGPTRTQPTP